MLSVELIDQFPRIPEIFRRFPAHVHVAVTRPWYEIMEFPIASLKIEDPVDFPLVRVIDDRSLWVRW